MAARFSANRQSCPDPIADNSHLSNEKGAAIAEIAS
jgi:hypothetical protein